MTNTIKEIIERMIKQEIRAILAENRDHIREAVKAVFARELRSEIQGHIPDILEDAVKVPQKPEVNQQATERIIPQASNEGQRSESDQILDSEVGISEVDSGTLTHESMKGRYLYCIAEGDERISFGKIGLEGEEVYTVPYNGLCAVVHNCRAEPYQSDDQERVKQWVVTHQKTVDTAWERFGTVIPIGFDTIIQGNGAAGADESMRNWLKEDFEKLRTKFEKVRGKSEFGVQIFSNPKVMAQKIAQESDAVRNLEEEIKSKPRGLAYMYRQKLEGLLKNEMENQADRCFKEFHERIKPHVSNLRVEKTKRTEDENKQMLMNLSCLLSEEGKEELGDELEKIEALEGFSVRYTGPWPPYSFV